MITKKILFFLVIALTVFLVVFKYFNAFKKTYANKIYPNIFLDGNPIGGKDKEELIKQFERKNQELQKITISIVYDNTPIATYSASTINLHTNTYETIHQAYLIGRSSDSQLQIYQKITSLLGLTKYYLTTTINYDRTPLNDLINLSEEKYNKPARNALFKFENGKVVSFRQEEYGLKILSDVFLTDFVYKIWELKQSPHSISINLKNQVVKPEVTLAEANEFGIEEQLTEGKSDFTHSAPERIHNITLAASKFDGVLIPKNKEFSFNETIGDISALTGYEQAYVIKNGKTVLGDGGGVCQVSTTLFRAALNAGLTITERYAHAYRVGYYESDSKPGFDATVFDPSADLKIKNNTPGAILIQTEIDKNTNILYFRLYGKNDGRKVEISPVTVYDQQPPLPAKYQDDPTLKRGVTKQVDFPAWGAKAKFDYKVINNDQVIFEKTFFSNYRPWQAVYLVGTAD